MAEILSTDILNLYRDHADIRRESAQENSDVRRDIAKEASDSRVVLGDIRQEAASAHAQIVSDVKTTGWNLSDRVGTEADRVVNQGTQYYIASQARDFDTARDIASLKSQTDMGFMKIGSDILAASQANAAATALESSKVAAAVALGQALLSKEIALEGSTTRANFAQSRFDTLNREMIERNSELLESKSCERYSNRDLQNAQFASMNSAMNNFQSQLQETKQGLVNFGTMSGTAGTQSSTSNNVR